MRHHVEPPGPDEPFERFYLKNVAISEGCGCAESVIAGSRARISRGNSIKAVIAAIRERFFSRKSVTS